VLLLILLVLVLIACSVVLGSSSHLSVSLSLATVMLVLSVVGAEAVEHPYLACSLSLFYLSICLLLLLVYCPFNVNASLADTSRSFYHCSS